MKCRNKERVEYLDKIKEIIDDSFIKDNMICRFCVDCPISILRIIGKIKYWYLNNRYYKKMR